MGDWFQDPPWIPESGILNSIVIQPALCIQGGSAFWDLSNHWSCSTYCVYWKYSKYNWTIQFTLALFIGQLLKWKSLSCVWLFATLLDYTVHWFLQARILEGVAIPFSMGESNPGLPHGRWILYQLSSCIFECLCLVLCSFVTYAGWCFHYYIQDTEQSYFHKNPSHYPFIPCSHTLRPSLASGKT